MKLSHVCALFCMLHMAVYCTGCSRPVPEEEYRTTMREADKCTIRDVRINHKRIEAERRGLIPPLKPGEELQITDEEVTTRESLVSIAASFKVLSERDSSQAFSAAEHTTLTFWKSGKKVLVIGIIGGVRETEPKTVVSMYDKDDNSHVADCDGAFADGIRKILEDRVDTAAGVADE